MNNDNRTTKKSLLSENTYFLAKTLSKYEHQVRRYHFLPALDMDKFENQSHVTNLESFESVTTVLTGVYYNKNELNNQQYYAHKKTGKKYFETRRDKYFIHLPFTDEWWKIGWNDSELKKIESKLECKQDSLSVDDSDDDSDDSNYSDKDFYAEYKSDSDMLIDDYSSEEESHSSMSES